MATIIDEAADRSNNALERMAASAERAERASEAKTIADAQAAVVTKKLADEEKAATEAAARFKAKMDTATGAAGSLVDAFVTYNKEVYKGSSANEAAAASMHKMGEAAKYAGAFLAILVPGGPIVKALVASLGLLAAKAAEAGAELALQTDAVYKSYQDLAKAGATGAGGMQDVFNSLQKVGLGTQKFGEYLKLVNSNANDLAMFGGTVNKGRKIFENTMGSLTDQQKIQMEQMGLNDTARAQATMDYIKQQRLLTAGSKSQMDTSSTAVMKYIKETDELTRITGANREEQQKILDKAMSEEIFASFIDELESQGEEGKKKAAEIRKQNAMAEKLLGPETARGIRDSLTGFIGASQASQKIYMASNGAISEYTDTLKNTTLAEGEGVKVFGKLAGAISNTYDTQVRGLAQMGVAEATFGKTSELRRAGLVDETAMSKAATDAEKERIAQLNDPLGKAQAKTAIDTQATQLMLQRKLNELMPAYVRELENTAEKNRKLVEATGKLADDVMDKLSPAFKKLLDALGPMIKKIGELMEDHVLPALVRAIENLAKFINWLAPKSEEEKAREQQKNTEVMSTQLTGVGRDYKLDNDETKAAEEQLATQEVGGVALSERDKAFLAQRLKEGGNIPKPDTTSQGLPATPATPATTSQGLPATEIPANRRRAAGGPVLAKTPYLVGEEGPELFVPSMAGDIVPTGQLQGTTGSALKQSDAIEKIVDQIVLDIKSRQKISDIDADRAKDHSEEQKIQTAKINKSINDIVVSSKELDSISKIDLKRAQDYSLFYKGFVETKTKFEKDQLEAINYQLTEGSGGGQQGGGSGGGLKLPSMPGIAGMGGGQGLQTTKQDDLSKMGLNIKAGDVQAEGAGISPRLIELARQIQGGVPGFGHFSAFNDKFHQEKAPSSQHAKGLALDFTVAQPPSLEEGKAITDWLKGLGASLAIDEYNNPSSKSTAGHFHAQIPGFEEGGMLGAGKVGIAGEGGKPELISGPASITPMNDLMGALNNLNAVMERSHNTLSEIARISKATSDSSAKMLSYAQN